MSSSEQADLPLGLVAVTVWVVCGPELETQKGAGERTTLAGLWNRWNDPASGELVESYTMLTINADSHPLMSRMHKPDPKLPADQQDKRSVIAIEMQDIDQWLAGTVREAGQLLKLAPVEMFETDPA